MDGGGDASQIVNRDPGSLCSSTLSLLSRRGLLITGQVTAPVVVRLPQDRPAFLQSRYEDSPINALAGLSPNIVRPALYREWLSLHARAHPPLRAIRPRHGRPAAPARSATTAVRESLSGHIAIRIVMQAPIPQSSSLWALFARILN